MTDHTTTGWVTFYRIRTADGRVLLVQKHGDGSSRTIVAASQRAHA